MFKITLRQPLDSVPQGTEYVANIFADGKEYVCSGKGTSPLEAIRDAKQNLTPDKLRYTPAELVINCYCID